MEAASPLLDIPHELAEHILKFCHVCDVSRVSQTCRNMHKLVYPDDDNYLWRELFLLYPFDDPRKRMIMPGEEVPDEMDWKGELQRRVLAERILLTDPASLEEQEEAVIRALSTMVHAVNIATRGPHGAESHNLTWVYNVLTKSPVLNDVSFKSEFSIIGQLQARLRCYLGLTHQTGESDASRQFLKELRTKSRCYTYDLRKYNRETYWGPYLVWKRHPSDDGELVVNWEHIEHIMNVIIMNIRDVPSEWEDIWPKWGLDATRLYSAPGSTRSRDPRDWAGVEGLWRRVVCFMDYRDLFAFNFSAFNDGPLNPAYFATDPRFSEAIRLMEYDIRLKGSSLVADRNAGSSGVDYEYSDPNYPTLYFQGTCRGLNNNSGSVEGSVRMFAPGVIRWNFVTAYEGSVNSWSAEGVQIGGLRSALGMAGVWSVALHEEVGDPAGPFWMWKAEEPVPRRLFNIPM
ncbi:hypothetical protein NM688_g2093 [Phlebia brevispora]|uniref:Uncharacterized protein n=1 Tax=Phlebia brevispora TaxID=194682 RepID=A0ACC1T9V3_9APHY|nr:hypothetical protein NM688_g2093 [Phlebia brevispora]